MRRYFALCLIFLLLFSLVGCEKFGMEDFLGSVEKPITDRQNEAVEETEPPTTLPVAETELPTETTQAPIPQVTVSDAFVDTITIEGYYGPETYCFHIPQFDIDTPEIDSLNRAIYQDLYGQLEKCVYADPEYPFLYGISYEWIQVENIVSLLVYMQYDWSMEVYKVYHAYADGSGMVSREELLKLYDLDEESLYVLAEQKMEAKYLSMYELYPGGNEDAFYQQQLENTISEENVRKIIPYISANGDLCCVATIYSLAGADSYDYLVGLTGSADPTNPLCKLAHN